MIAVSSDCLCSSSSYTTRYMHDWMNINLFLSLFFSPLSFSFTSFFGRWSYSLCNCLFSSSSLQKVRAEIIKDTYTHIHKSYHICTCKCPACTCTITTDSKFPCYYAHVHAPWPCVCCGSVHLKSISLLNLNLKFKRI